MPRRNRVNPFGEIVATPERGLMMGNRGVLHDDAGAIVRDFQVRRWLICRTEFRGRRRIVMQPGRYTELFFLDEATALAAGHRPCAECRRAAYQAYRHGWVAAHGGPSDADAIDRVLHAQRRRSGDDRTHLQPIDALPDGTFVALGGAPWLVWDDAVVRWSFAGYTEARERPRRTDVPVITPRATVAAMRYGYRPLVHPSAMAPARAPQSERAQAPR